MIYEKTCLYCEKDFESNSINAIYCSTLCSGRYYYRKNYKTKNTSKCIHCNSEFSRKANKHNTCNKCKEMKKQGIKPDMKVEIKNRDYTENEKNMINEFLKAN